jgi:hypothetical protein
MMGAGGSQPLTETALGQVARVLADNLSGGTRNTWTPELAASLSSSSPSAVLRGPARHNQ